MRMIPFLFLAIFLIGAPALAAKTPSGLPVPRFVSLKFAEVNGRAGPSSDHPIQWVYRRQGLPMQVVAETENWRRVRDPEGEVVWVHKRTLDGRRTAIAMRPAEVFARPDRAAQPQAVADPGVVVQVRGCRDEWLRVTVDGYKGWALADDFWGGDCETADETSGDALEG